MHTRFTSFVSGLTLSVLLAGPVFAQTPVDAAAPQDPQDLIMSCRETTVPTYQSSLDAAVLALRGSIINEWKHQVGFRLNAARPARRALTERALAQAGTQLDAALTQFANAQNSGLTKDVGVAVDSYVRLDDQAEQDALTRWSDRTVSFQALNTALTRAERSLRLYASARDRATLSSVWNATRKQAEEAFLQSRDDARQQFVSNMDDCIGGVKADDYSEVPATDTSATDKSTDGTTTSKETSTRPTGFAVTSINLDTASDYASTCSQKITARARIYTNGVGRTVGHFVYQDGVTSPEIVADTDATGATYAQDQRTFSASSAAFSSGWVKYVITSPNSFTSDRADFKIQCQGATNPQQPNGSSASDKDKQASYAVSFTANRNVFRPTDADSTLVLTATMTNPPIALSDLRISIINNTGDGRSVMRTCDGVATCVFSIGMAAERTNTQRFYAEYTNRVTGQIITTSFVQDILVYGTTSTPSSQPSSNDTKADARLLVDGKAEVNTCGAYRYTFTGTITYGAAGTVKYYWLRSDGNASSPETVTFYGPGTKTISTTWDLSSTYAGWVRLMIISPNMTQSQADFNLIEACGSTSKTTTPSATDMKSDTSGSSSAASGAKVGALVGMMSKQDASVCGAYNFQFQGSITTDSAAKIVYRWERSDGVVSPETTIAAEKAGTYAASESWNLSGTNYAGWVQLHVLSPSDMSSNQAAFTLTQACK